MYSVSSESQASNEECIIEDLFSYFLIKTYVLCAQKKRLSKAVLLSTQKRRVKNIGNVTIIRTYVWYSSEDLCFQK